MMILRIVRSAYMSILQTWCGYRTQAAALGVKAASGILSGIGQALRSACLKDRCHQVGTSFPNLPQLGAEF